MNATKRITGRPLKREPEYGSWRGMLQRCRDPNHAHYANYGGRGITVDPRWLDFWKFQSDMGPKPSPARSGGAVYIEVAWQRIQKGWEVERALTTPTTRRSYNQPRSA